MKARINAVYVTVLDMKRGVSFYEELFETAVTEFDERMSSFVFGDFTLLLYDPSRDDVEPLFGDNVVINIEVDDVAATFETLTSQGCEVVVPMTTIEPDVFFQVKDSEGNTLEFYQVLAAES